MLWVVSNVLREKSKSFHSPLKTLVHVHCYYSNDIDISQHWEPEQPIQGGGNENFPLYLFRN